MPRYFFDIQYSGERVIPDEEGEVFGDLSAARKEASASIGDLVGEAIRSGGQVSGLRIEIRDETGATLESVLASEVFH